MAFVARNGCLRRCVLSLRDFASSTHSTKKMIGRPPVLPKVEKHDIPRLFKLDKQSPGTYRASFHGDESEMGMNIYGGLLFAQGLEAAQLDVPEGFLPTSFHTLFVSYPFAKFPVDYQVDKLRDGKSFCARNVKGIQNDQVVFAALANFAKPSETSIHHTLPLPDVPKPEDVTDIFEYCELKLNEIKSGKLTVLKMIEDNFKRRLYDKPYSVIDVRPINPENYFMMKSFSNIPMRYWIKSSIKLDDDPKTHRLLLAYLSDMYLVGAAVYPHISQGNKYNMVASLDNTIWFHDYEFKADDNNNWLLYEVQSPVADGGRAISYGKIWTQDGRLIASTAQEVLARFSGQSKF